MKWAQWGFLVLAVSVSGPVRPDLARAEESGRVSAGAKAGKAKGRRSSKARVVLPGFQVLADGGTRVLVQTDKPVQPLLRRGASGWEVVIPDAVLPKGNVRRPLDTQHFNTPLTRAQLSPGQGGVVLSLSLRAQVEPRLRTEQTQAGFFTYVEFAAGQYR